MTGSKDEMEVKPPVFRLPSVKGTAFADRVAWQWHGCKVCSRDAKGPPRLPSRLIAFYGNQTGQTGPNEPTAFTHCTSDDCVLY